MPCSWRYRQAELVPDYWNKPLMSMLARATCDETLVTRKADRRGRRDPPRVLAGFACNFLHYDQIWHSWVRIQELRRRRWSTWLRALPLSAAQAPGYLLIRKISPA